MADVIKQDPIRTEYSDGTVVISNVRSKRNNSNTSFTVVNNWYDGTPMDDSKVDSFGIYSKVKSTGDYIKENLPNWGEKFLEVDTIAQLRDLSPYYQHLILIGYYKGVTVNGYWTEGDTPQSLKYLLTQTLQDDDGGSIIAVGLLKFAHTFLSSFDVRYFGAKCDYDTTTKTGTDDTSAWQRSINYCNGRAVKEICFDGRSMVSTTLYFNFSGLVIKGQSAETSRLIKKGHDKHIGFGTIALINYDNIDAVLMSVDYVGDFTFTRCKFESEDKSDYVLYLARTYRFMLDDIYLVGAVQNLRCIQAWNCNLRKTRSRFCDYAFVFEGLNPLNPDQHTSINFDNCYAEYAKFGFKLVNVAYFSGNAVSSDNIDECCYWFDYSVGSFNGVGTEKSKGQLIRCWRSNIEINGHQVLEIKNYTGTPIEAKSKAKIEVWTQGRTNTGLQLNSSSIRGYSSGNKTGDADWLYVGTDTFVKFANWNHTIILADNINGRTINGVFERDNYDGYDRMQGDRSYKINELDLLPYTYGYNQTRTILRLKEVVIVRTQSTDIAITSATILIVDLQKVFPDFVVTDFYIRDFYNFKIQSYDDTNNTSVLSHTPFSRTNVYPDKTFKIGDSAILESVIVGTTDVTFTFSKPVHRPIITISRLTSGNDYIKLAEIDSIPLADATDATEAIVVANACKAKLNEFIEEAKLKNLISNV